MKRPLQIIAITAVLSALLSGQVQAQETGTPRAAADQPTRAAAATRIAETAAQDLQSALQKAEKLKAEDAVAYEKTYEKIVQLAKPAPTMLKFGPPFGNDSTSFLAVRTSNASSASDATLQEDLNVMAHILDKATGDKSESTAMGVKLTVLSSRDVVNSLYLDGYGALFTMSVNFPLLPPPAAANAKVEPETPKPSTTWEQAKRELYPQPGDSYDARLGLRIMDVEAASAAKRSADSNASKYDADKVNKLRDSLVEAMRNAANIRELKPDDSVTVCVSGSSSDTAMRALITTGPVRVAPRAGQDFSGGGIGGGGNGGSGLGGNGLGGGGEVQVRSYMGAVSTASAAGATKKPGTLTIRVKKSDATAFANGSITQEEFRKRMSILTY